MKPSTFSIVAADLATGEIGVAVQSRFLAVGSVVPFVCAGVGAIATQAFANTSYGPKALHRLRAGDAPSAIVEALIAGDDDRDERQFGIVAADGTSATYTGKNCIEAAAGRCGPSYAAQGNCLAGTSVVDALAQTFLATPGPLVDRLLAALHAAQAEGGDKRGQQSAALCVEKPKGGYAGFNDRYVDLRVDDHVAPIEELGRLLQLHKLYFFEAEARDVFAVDATLGAEIVRELVRIGVLAPGSAVFDDAARSALIAYMHVENLENRVRKDGTIDRQTLDYLRSAGSKLHA